MPQLKVSSRPSLSNRDVILRSAERATKDLVASASRSTALPCHTIHRFAKDDRETDRPPNGLPLRRLNAVSDVAAGRRPAVIETRSRLDTPLASD